MIKTVKVRLDSIMVVARVIEKAIAADRRPIEKSRYVESGEPFDLRDVVAGMTRLELANQLIENQSAFHFAFIPMVLAVGFEPTLYRV